MCPHLTGNDQAFANSFVCGIDASSPKSPSLPYFIILFPVVSNQARETAPPAGMGDVNCQSHSHSSLERLTAKTTLRRSVNSVRR